MFLGASLLTTEGKEIERECVEGLIYPCDNVVLAPGATAVQVYTIYT